LRTPNKILLYVCLLSALFLSAQFIGCAGAGGGSPKDVVIKLFGAMERNDRAGIVNLLDMAALMNITDHDYALQRKEPRVFHNPEALLDDLTGTGLTKTKWFNMQRVVGNTEIHGDTAYVEVSFISKKTNTQYYNKFGLHRQNGRWRIYSFKTISDSK
jgi:hypothetical protein